MKLKRTIALVSFTLLFNSPLWATDMKTSVLTTNPTTTDTEISEIELFNMSQWGMLQSEWRKYKLYSNENSPYNKYLDLEKTTPYRIMYQYATSAELKHKWLVREAEFFAKMLKNDGDYFNGLEIAAGTVVAKVERSPYAPEHLNSFGPVKLAPMDNGKVSRSLMFVDLDSCDDSCESFIKDTLQSSGEKHRLDIIVKGTNGNEKMLIEFAKKMKISAELVNTRSVTLNFDTGESKALSVTMFPSTIHKNILGVVSESHE